MIKKFRKKPVTIEAVQWNGNTNFQEVCDFVGIDLKQEEFSLAAYEAGQGKPLYSLIIPTLEGNMLANPKDYIIKGVNGEFYPCKADIFEKTYDSNVERKTIKTKFNVSSITTYGNNGGAKVTLNAAINGDENKEWSENTPNGTIELYISNHEATFEHGFYYVTLEKAE